MKLRLIILCIVLSSCLSIPDRYWFCGSGFLLTKLAKMSLETCDEKYDYNHCCAIHDDCYGQKLGQELCDKQFCQCTKSIASAETAKCREFAEFSCSMVEMFGKGAYTEQRTSVIYTEKYVIRRSLKVAKMFRDIYEKCDNQYETFKSCGYQFDTCMLLKKNPSECESHLSTCLMDSKKHRNPNPSCDQVIDQHLRNKRSTSEWYCGSGAFSENMAKIALHDCPQKLEFNLCCAIHDDCYDAQRGQQLCDQQFCDCNEKIHTCESYAKSSCMMVKTLGKSAYEKSGKPKPYEHKQSYFKNQEKLGEMFKRLAETCYNQPATMGALASRFDECMSQQRTSKICRSQSNTILHQALVICALDQFSSTVYVAMNFIQLPEVTVIIAQHFWEAAHGFPVMTYLTMNPTIRSRFFEMIFGKKDK